MERLNIPADVAETLREFYTCEMTTVNRQGQPITWPALTAFDEPNGRLILSVSIAFPVKALNARRHPQVSLLYSDATGAGLADPVATLVQGDATVFEATDPLCDEMRLLSKVAERRQPDSSQFTANPVARKLFAWYLFQRMVITITPRRLLVWLHRDFSQAPTIITLAPPDAALDTTLATVAAVAPLGAARPDAAASDTRTEAPDVE